MKQNVLLPLLAAAMQRLARDLSRWLMAITSSRVSRRSRMKASVRTMPVARALAWNVATIGIVLVAADLWIEPAVPL